MEDTVSLKLSIINEILRYLIPKIYNPYTNYGNNYSARNKNYLNP